jgi:phosphate transport system substrate-binding protein
MASKQSSMTHRPRRRRTTALLLVAVALIAVGCTTSRTAPATPTRPASGKAAPLTGAGATFPAPIYKKWFADFGRRTGARVSYDAVGSGEGILQFTARRIDFGATDVPLNDIELAQAEAIGGPVLHIPTVLGAVAVAYNLPGVTGLKLDGQLIGELFLGRVVRWNDRRIAALNPGAQLPDLPLTIVHRSDSSGTTANFTAFVASQHPEFRSRVGDGKEVSWPTGKGADGNGDLADLIAASPGAVGYVELSYAVDRKLEVAAVKNHAGRFIVPSSTTAATAAQDLAGLSAINDFQVSPAATTADQAYPITTYTFLVVFQRQFDVAKGTALIRLLRYMIGEGQASATDLHYAPLPPSLRKLILAKLQLLTGPDGTPLASHVDGGRARLDALPGPHPTPRASG